MQVADFTRFQNCVFKMENVCWSDWVKLCFSVLLEQTQKLSFIL